MAVPSPYLDENIIGRRFFGLSREASVGFAVNVEVECTPKNRLGISLRIHLCEVQC